MIGYPVLARLRRLAHRFVATRRITKWKRAYFCFMDVHVQPLEIIRDDLASTHQESVFRANLPDETAVNAFVDAYSGCTNTTWIVQKVQKRGERYVLIRWVVVREASFRNLGCTVYIFILAISCLYICIFFACVSLTVEPRTVTQCALIKRPHKPTQTAHLSVECISKSDIPCRYLDSQQFTGPKNSAPRG